MEEKDKGGRPLKFKLYQIENAWQEFKSLCDNAVKHEVSAGKVLPVPCPRIYTLSAFQVYLGISREGWSDYRTYEAFSDTIKQIEAEVMARKEGALANAEGSTTGLIFDFKCNHGWQDKQVIESKVEVTSVEVVVKAAESMAIPTSEKDVEIDK